MFSKPDFRQKQILFIQTKDLADHLKLQNDNLVLTRKLRKEKQQEAKETIVEKISLYKIFVIFILGDTTFTTKILAKLASFGISIFFLKSNLRYYSSFEPKSEGNYLIRQKQYNLNSQQELGLAKILIKNKTQNQLRLLKKEVDNTSLFLEEFQNWQNKIQAQKSSNSLLAVEGNLAKIYFQNYFQAEKQIQWLRRIPRAKPDIPNLLLDIGYTYIFNYTDSLLRVFGFDTYKGFYHKLFFQRKSLSCDLVEVFRPIIDRTLLKMYRLNQVNSKDFKYFQNSYHLSWAKSSKYSAIFLQAILNYKLEIYTYIQDFYRYFMRPDKYPKPKFNINKNYHQK